MKKKQTAILAIALSTLHIVSCYPLPSPTYSVIRYGIDAELVDQVTLNPLKDREVMITVDSYYFKCKSSRAGKVTVSPTKDRYWTWLGGPIQMSNPKSKISIATEGYEPTQIEWSMLEKSRLPVTNGRIQVGELLIKRRQ